MELEELYEKYEIIEIGLKRLYRIDLSKDHYVLSSCTPESLRINELFIEERGWTQIIRKLILYLQSVYKKNRSELYKFVFSWTNKRCFFETDSGTNMIKIEEGVFFHNNYTAEHSVMVIKEIIQFYNLDINQCFLFIHKPTTREPKEIVEAVEKIRINQFRNYLSDLNTNNERTEKIIRSIKVFGGILAKNNRSDNNFFLMDNYVMANAKSFLLKNIDKFVLWNDAQKKVARMYLDYLTDFYRQFNKN